MKHKILVPTVIVTGVTFLTILIISLVMSQVVNLDQELTNLKNYAGGNEGFVAYLDDIISQKNITNVFQLASFSFWIEGAVTLYQIHSFATASFIILWIFIFPIIGVIFAIVFITYISLVIIEFIKREYQYKQLKAVGKWGMYSSFLALVVFAIIFVFMIGFLETQFDGIKLGDNTGIKQPVAEISRINAFNFLLNGSLALMLENGFNKTSSLILDQNVVSVSLLIGTGVFLYIFLPIAFLCTIVFSSIWIATFTCQRNSGLSKFNRWLGNIRIDSKREFRQVIVRNWCFWVLLGFLLVTIIYPGFVHEYKTSAQITIATITACMVPLLFIPIYIATIKINTIKRFNYNKMMFAQTLILGLFVSFWQIIIWALFGEQIMGPIWLMFSLPFVTLFTSILCIFGFIKWNS